MKDVSYITSRLEGKTHQYNCVIIVDQPFLGLPESFVCQFINETYHPRLSFCLKKPSRPTMHPGAHTAHQAYSWKKSTNQFKTAPAAKKFLKTPLNGSERVQIVISGGDDEGFRAGLGRTLTKPIQTSYSSEATLG